MKRNFIITTPKRYLLNSTIVYLKAEVSARSRWKQVSGTPVHIDNPDSPNTFYLTAGYIEPAEFEICLVEFPGFCQRVQIIPYDPNNPEHVRYELDEPSFALEDTFYYGDPIEYKLTPEQLYNLIYPLSSSGQGNNFRSDFQPHTGKVITFREPSSFILSAISQGGGNWSILQGNLTVNANVVNQTVSYWGGTVELQINNYVTPERFERLRINTNPQSFLCSKLLPVVYRLDGVFNRFFDKKLRARNYVYVLEGRRYENFEVVATYEYRQYGENNKPYFVPYRECFIRPIEYRIYREDLVNNTRELLFSFTIDLTKQLKLNLINNDAMIGFAGVNYTVDTSLLVNYLPVQDIRLDVVIDDIENLSSLPGRYQDNCADA